MVAQMVAKAWYPRVYFRLSFGFQEKLATIIDKIHALDTDNCISKSPEIIINFLLASEIFTSEMCKPLTRYVPTRFSNPWLKTNYRKTF